jgi:hypothetical protein
MTGKYISELEVIINDAPVPLEFERIPFDLNKGAGGEFIWLCYKRSDNQADAITALYSADNDQPSPPPGYRKIDVDLNMGAEGKFIWLCYSKIPALGTPLIDILVAGSSAPSPEYKILDYDLNNGAGGEFIYIYYK